MLEPEEKPTVLYSIQTALHNVEGIQVALETWAKDLRPGQLQVVGMDHPKGVHVKGISWHKSKCPDSHAGGACKDFTALAEAREKEVDWVVLLGTDNYAVTSNIEAALSQHSSSEPQVLGIRGCGDCAAGGLCGGGGQLFNRGALEKMLEAGRSSYLQQSMSEAKSCGMWGDVSNCRVAALHGVPVGDLPGLHGWHLKPPQLSQALGSSYPAPLTFHYLNVDEIKALHAMLQEQAEAFLVGNAGLQAQGLAMWWQDRDRYVKEEQGRRELPA